MHLAALSVFERTDREEAVEQLVKAACRKFSGSAKVLCPACLLCRQAASRLSTCGTQFYMMPEPFDLRGGTTKFALRQKGPAVAGAGLASSRRSPATQRRRRGCSPDP